MSLSEDVGRIAEAAARYAAPGEELAAVCPSSLRQASASISAHSRQADGHQSWLALDDRGSPLTNRTLIRDAASIAALVEIAEESARSCRCPSRGSHRLSISTLSARRPHGDVAGALQSALPAIDELTRDLELNYKLELE